MVKVILRVMDSQSSLVLSPTLDPWPDLGLYVAYNCLSPFGHTLWQCRSAHSHKLLSSSVTHYLHTYFLSVYRHRFTTPKLCTGLFFFFILKLLKANAVIWFNSIHDVSVNRFDQELWPPWRWRRIGAETCRSGNNILNILFINAFCWF
jgi:hypothetical protein